MHETYRRVARRRSECEQVQSRVRVMRSVHRAGNDLYDHQISLGMVQIFIPLPAADLGQIHTVVADVLAMLHQLILHLLDEVCAAIAQLRQRLTQDADGSRRLRKSHNLRR